MELHFPLILDGATGTELQKRGYTGDVSAEQWVLAHPDSILSIQRDYVAAGSQVLYTPTFGGNAVKLAEHGVTEDTAAYNRRLADLSRQAADGKALLAGDLSPTGLFLAPLGSASFDQLVDAYAQQAAGLETAGVDLYIIETMMTLSDARAQRLRQAHLRHLDLRPEWPQHLRHRHHRRPAGIAGHGHRRLRSQLLGGAGPDAAPAPPPA